MPDDGFLLTDSLDPDAIAQLDATSVRVTSDQVTDLRTLVGAWERHVRKIEQDLDQPDSDRSTWGAHDLIAAASLRSFVQEGVDSLTDGLLEGARTALITIDEKFKSFTEDDAVQWVRLVDSRLSLPEAWWWHRIPQRGPIRRELERIAERIERDG